MFADRARFVGGLVPCLLIAAPAMAQTVPTANPPATPPAPDWEIKLTEAAEPDAVAWRDPARISVTIDTRGKDKFSAQLNLELQHALNISADREGRFGPYIRWNRESGGSKEQNNLELGASLEIDSSTDIFNRPAGVPNDRLSDEADRRHNRTSWGLKASSGYARTASYPDLASAVCVATPTLPQCQVQFQESIRSGLQLYPFGLWQESGTSNSLTFTIDPKIGFDHDLLLNRPVDAATGVSRTGGYLSAVGALKLKITPGFINPRWELAASAQLRQALARSPLRRDEIEQSAELFTASATYFFVVPTDTSQWRAGFGVTFTRGNDPLTGKPDASTIQFALRVGRY